MASESVISLVPKYLLFPQSTGRGYQRELENYKPPGGLNAGPLLASTQVPVSRHLGVRFSDGSTYCALGRTMIRHFDLQM